jgi:hypothetical protein
MYVAQLHYELQPKDEDKNVTVLLLHAHITLYHYTFRENCPACFLLHSSFLLGVFYDPEDED